jgi:hypothetical protein
MAMLVFELIQVGAVRAISEKQRHCCDQRDFPGSVVDHFDECHTDARPDDVVRTAQESNFRPRSIDRPFREERHDDVGRDAPHEAIRENGSRNWHRLPRPHEVAHRATERQMRCACGLCRNHAGRSVQEDSAWWMCAL